MPQLQNFVHRWIKLNIENAKNIGVRKDVVQASILVKRNLMLKAYGGFRHWKIWFVANCANFWVGSNIFRVTLCTIGVITFGTLISPDYGFLYLHRNM